MLNIVLPMAGRGSRFAEAGYAVPKPLIPVHGFPMIQMVIANLRPSHAHRFIFLVLAEHLEQHAIGERLRNWAPGSIIVPIEEVTEGAACTVLLAREFIDEDQPLMIANCDQYVDTNIDRYLACLEDADGLIMTMKADDPKWSFVRFDSEDRVVEVVEKQVVSNEGTVGIYNFARGRDFVNAADEMVNRELRVNGEFYVAPTYNLLIREGARIVVDNIGAVGRGMHGVGVPADLDAFLAEPVSQRAVAGLTRK